MTHSCQLYALQVTASLALRSSRFERLLRMLSRPRALAWHSKAARPPFGMTRRCPPSYWCCMHKCCVMMHQLTRTSAFAGLAGAAQPHPGEPHSLRSAGSVWVFGARACALRQDAQAQRILHASPAAAGRCAWLCAVRCRACRGVCTIQLLTGRARGALLRELCVCYRGTSRGCRCRSPRLHQGVSGCTCRGASQKVRVSGACGCARAWR